MRQTVDNPPGETEKLLAEVEILRASVVELERRLERPAKRQRAHTERDQLFRTFLENINEVIWMQESVTNRLIYVSPAFKRIWGQSNSALYKNPRLWLESVHEDDRERVKKSTERMFNNVAYAEEYRIVRPDGSVRWIWARGFPICGSNGEVNYIIGIAEDISERRLAERAVQRAERLASIGTLAAGIAHEINNPIGAILLAAEFAQDSDGLPLRAKDALADIAREAVLCGSIVSSVLQFARADASEKRRYDLNRVVLEAAEFIRARSATNDEPTLELGLADMPCMLRLNRTELVQAVVNLVENASAAGASTVRIETARQQDGGFELTVADDGSGIEPEVIKHVFDPFFSTRRDQGGSGLGLSITHRVVNDHRGTITVQSDPGRGALFQLRFPEGPDEENHSRRDSHDEDSGR